MKLSHLWLNEYISKKISAHEAAEILTSTGLEVEEIEPFESIKGGLKGLVVGHVLTCEKHPDADKLSITTVDLGMDAPQQIVCGAPNVAAGQKVVVATVGTVLYSGEESFTIKKSKIRGVESNGMICAEDEIGLGTSHDGILILPENTPVGIPAAEYFNISNDTVLEVNITPNRSDATSHIGSARDIVAFLKQKDQSVSLLKPAVNPISKEVEGCSVTINIENKNACLRYAGVALNQVEIKPSPEWLQNKLKAIGVKCINNVVDVTNYVLHETGHPMHAFDCAKIEGGKIVIKNAQEGDRFTTLDKIERTLSQDDLMIWDAQKPIAMAGVMGGLDSGVTENTNTIFLESAYFSPVSVRKTAKRHGIHSDSSFRFERGADPEIIPYALQRAVDLLKDVANAKVCSEVIDLYPTPVQPATLKLSFDRINAMVGQAIPAQNVYAILEALEIKAVNQVNGEMELQIPSFKVDVTRDVDVIEEILRIYGYNEILLSDTIQATFNGFIEKTDVQKRKFALELLSKNGFREMLTNSLSNGKYLSLHPSFDEESTVNILNPISSELNILRRTMLFNGLEVVSHNINHKNSDLKLFELGKTYQFDHSIPAEKKHGKYVEKEMLSILIAGNYQKQQWFTGAQKTDFYYIKGIVKSVLEQMNAKYFPFSEETHGLLENAFSTSGLMYKNEKLVTFGEVSAKVLKAFDIKQPVFYAEINWNALVKNISDKPKFFEEITKFPSVRRDLALLVDQKVTYGEIEKIAYGTNKKLLKEVDIFDIYQGKNLPEGKKSYAVSFIFQDVNKTLTDKEIEQAMEQLINNYAKELQAEIRG